MRTRLQTLLAATAALGGAILPLSSPAQTFPDRPIRIVVPYPPGGLTDVSARKLAELAGADLGQVIVVENKPGAHGSLGTAHVARDKAGGCSIVAVTTTRVLIAPLLSKLF